MRYFALSLLILFLGYFGVLDPVRDFFQGAVSPIQYGLSGGARSIKDSIGFYSNLKKIRTENLFLNSRVIRLESQLVELENLKNENKILRDQVGSNEEIDLKNTMVIADVIGNSNDLTGSTFYLNKGTDHGVRNGDNVILQNFLVGIVKSAGKNRSLVDLVTSNDVSVTVFDQTSQQKIEGIATGQYGTSLLVERILSSEEISIGDVMFTSGKDGLFVPGLYVGKVSEVISDPAQPLKSAYLNTVTDYSKLDKVFILIGGNNE